jgi:hypothetical protein
MNGSSYDTSSECFVFGIDGAEETTGDYVETEQALRGMDWINCLIRLSSNVWLLSSRYDELTE